MITDQTIAHYKILEKLGEGGMGEVYLAEDIKLDRKVALKFLPHHASLDADANTRFQREAKAAAVLNHPNIITVYEIGEHEGRAFITMEYIKGQSLREKIKSATAPLPIDEVINIVSQVCDGLVAAHQAGITHRDLKPENLMIATDGRVKILDFGLAKLRGVTKLTADAITLGTISYMSPEQARGEEVDHRTDIWSLGVVMYEMLTGQLPFKGEYELAVVYAILNENPKLITSLRADVPIELAQVVTKSLAKNTDKRYQQTEEMLFDLSLAKKQMETGRAGEEPPKRKSIAVLPFTNMSADPEQEYFCDGITEDIITQICKIRELKVISRTSVMQYKGRKDKNLREIGIELNVTSILEGSVRKAGNRVRIVAQLIDAQSDEHLWAESYDREMIDIFDIQSDVARQIASALEAKLSLEENDLINRKPTEDLEAYDLYLLGRYHMNKRNDEGIKKAIAFFEEAIKKDPKYAVAYSGLADAYILAGIGYSAMIPKDALSQAKAVAMRALELDDTLPEAHTSLAYVSVYNWDWSAAKKEFERALELNPSHAQAYEWYGHYLIPRRQFEAALVAFKRARELDPLSVVINTELGWPDMYMGNYDQAIEYFRRALKMDPNFGLAYFNLGNCYERKGMYETAIAEYHKALSLFGKSPILMAFLAKACAASGRSSEARKILDELIMQSNQGIAVSLYVALCYEALGEKELALAWLERAFSNREAFASAIGTNWLPFESLNTEPRFTAMLEKLELDK